MHGYILAVAAGVLPYLDDYGVTNYTGFCRVDTGSVTYILSVAIAVLTAFLFFALNLIDLLHSHNGVHQEKCAGDIKKAVAKVLAYLHGHCIISVIHQWHCA